MPVENQGRIRLLILLRHGETTAPPGVFVGSKSDPTLSERGRAQARAVGDRLRSRAIAAVVSSPLRRAQQTATLAFPGYRVSIDARLVEEDFGRLTGLTWSEAKALYGDVARAWRTGVGPAPGGEGHEDLQQRVVAAAVSALADVFDAEGDIVLVTHHTPIRALVAFVRGWTPADWRRIQVPHAGLRVVRVEGDLARSLRCSDL